MARATAGEEPRAIKGCPTSRAGVDALARAVDTFGGRMLSAADVAALFDVEPRTVTEWARSGQLPGLLPTRRAGWHFNGNAVKAFALARYEAAAPAGT